jgi:hypothetical protein
MKKTCRWVKECATTEKPAVYCGQPVKYTMEPDGGEPGAPLKRKYKAFCEPHQLKADAEDE